MKGPSLDQPQCTASHAEDYASLKQKLQQVSEREIRTQAQLAMLLEENQKLVAKVDSLGKQLQQGQQYRLLAWKELSHSNDHSISYSGGELSDHSKNSNHLILNSSLPFSSSLSSVTSIKPTELEAKCKRYEQTINSLKTELNFSRAQSAATIADLQTANTLIQQLNQQIEELKSRQKQIERPSKTDRSLGVELDLRKKESRPNNSGKKAGSVISHSTENGQDSFNNECFDLSEKSKSSQQQTPSQQITIEQLKSQLKEYKEKARQRKFKWKAHQDKYDCHPKKK